MGGVHLCSWLEQSCVEDYWADFGALVHVVTI